VGFGNSLIGTVWDDVFILDVVCELAALNLAESLACVSRDSTPYVVNIRQSLSSPLMSGIESASSKP